MSAFPQITLDEAAGGTHEVTHTRSHISSPQLVHFVLEYVEVVGSRHCDDVVLGMPRSVKDLLVEVQTVHADFILLTFATSAHFAGL